MSDQEAVFDGNWEDELEGQNKQPEKQGCLQHEHEDQKKVANNQQKFSGKGSLVDQLRGMTDDDFDLTISRNKKIKESGQQQGRVLSLTKEQDFIDLAKITAQRFEKKAEDEPENVVNDNNLVTFFEEMLLYLYPKYGWENIEHAKQKLKIVKKSRKQEQSKVKKQKQKQERLKKTGRVKEEESDKKQSRQE